MELYQNLEPGYPSEGNAVMEGASRNGVWQLGLSRKLGQNDTKEPGTA